MVQEGLVLLKRRGGLFVVVNFVVIVVLAVLLDHCVVLANVQIEF